LTPFQPSVAGQPLAAETNTTVLVAPSSTDGFVGGESHMTYAYDAHKGEKLSIRIDWRRENGNSADFMVGESMDMADAKPLACSRWSTDRRQWKCTVAKDGRLYIEVVAYPSAHFTLTLHSNGRGGRARH